MKITELKTFVVGNPWKNWIFVKLYTDEGLTGLGEATGGLATKPNLGDVEELTRFVIGEDPRHPDKIWQKMYRGRFANPSTGMSGIELACWDLLGKSLGVPVWQLLGGKHRDQLRVYANGWYQGPRDPLFFADRAKNSASTLCAPCARPSVTRSIFALRATTASPLAMPCASAASWHPTALCSSKPPCILTISPLP
jgi:L-alanine-DL-glutamate epimerase-like enolase superfamily enzyme